MIYHSGARGPLPLRHGEHWPTRLLTSNICALLPPFAWAMNPGLVAFGPVHLHNLSSVRSVPLDNSPTGKTFAVVVDASTYPSIWELRHPVVPEDTGHVARQPDGRRREVPCFSPGVCHR